MEIAKHWCTDSMIGAASAALTKTMVAPIDRTRLIYATKAHSVDRPFSVAVAKQLYELDGIRGFFRGNLPNVLRYIPHQALTLATKDAFNDAIFRPHWKTELRSAFAANTASGCMAAAAVSLALHPLSRARDLFTADMISKHSERQFTGLFDCLIKTVQRPQGIRDLYAGIGLASARVMLYRGVTFGVFDTFKLAGSDCKSGELPEARVVLSTLLLALLSGASAGIVSYPLDAIHVRIRAERFNEILKPDEARECKGVLSHTSEVIKAEGVRGLFHIKGASAAMITRNFGMPALVLFFYDMAQRCLGRI